LNFDYFDGSIDYAKTIVLLGVTGGLPNRTGHLFISLYHKQYYFK